ncbi:hypothetical protein LVD15_01335 [Fulvivirga maritima]|uniref:hypothetical protein n=1 Tax=Fulvivirga maritima TaxID=2904247 RepID=UPI001F1DF3B6|nr:hypothetical protein [Fulvivirga maritima]UII27096.1 hypothetical protein LVD15_01335 [Fulvivirga maritima]
MKTTIKYFCLLLTSLTLLTSCGPKPQYKTSLGKKKLKHYNSVQYGTESPKTFKSFKRQK